MHFENKARDQISNRKKRKIEIFDFEVFQKKMHMPSRGKYILHILFGAFQVTPRISTSYKLPIISELGLRRVAWTAQL